MDIPRLMAKVAVDDAGCWIWLGAIGSTGYGRTFHENSDDYAHRVSYKLHKGPIPEGLYVDHLCEEKRCVNPEHLEAVSQAENVRRYWRKFGFCKNGHEYTEENTYRRPDKVESRACRTCRKNRKQEFQERAKASRKRKQQATESESESSTLSTTSSSEPDATRSPSPATGMQESPSPERKPASPPTSPPSSE